MPKSPRVLLVSLRDDGDPIIVHEHACFAREAGIEPSQLDVHQMVHGALSSSTLTPYDAVFFGGSGAYSVLDDVHWIRQGLDALRTVVDARIPAWASCFGFQGLALALGGEVIHDASREELGSTRLRLTPAGQEDALLGTLPSSFWGQEGHHDRVSTLPDGVISLVTGEVCPEQAFRVDGAPFWASQFHPELRVDGTVLRFRHYLEHYFHGTREEAEVTLRRLESGPETPEVNRLLWHLVHSLSARV